MKKNRLDVTRMYCTKIVVLKMLINLSLFLCWFVHFATLYLCVYFSWFQKEKSTAEKGTNAWGKATESPDAIWKGIQLLKCGSVLLLCIIEVLRLRSKGFRAPGLQPQKCRAPGLQGGLLRTLHSRAPCSQNQHFCLGWVQVKKRFGAPGLQRSSLWDPELLNL